MSDKKCESDKTVWKIMKREIKNNYDDMFKEYKRIRYELENRVKTIIEDCDQFHTSKVPDDVEIAFEDGAIWVNWSVWHGTGYGEYIDYSEKFPYEYLNRDICELNNEYAERQRLILADKLLSEVKEKHRVKLETIEHEKSELKRLQKKYPKII